MRNRARIYMYKKWNKNKRNMPNPFVYRIFFAFSLIVSSLMKIPLPL